MGGKAKVGDKKRDEWETSVTPEALPACRVPQTVLM
jgi:hypothetical protein